MKQLFNRIFNTLLVLSITIGGLTFVITSYFSEDIEKAVLASIQENLEVPVLLNDIEFTIWDNFPAASVKFTNLLVHESEEFKQDTLLFTKKAYVEISLLNILRKSYDFKNIILIDGVLNIKYNTENLPNFLILKQSENKKRNVSISQLTLLNTNLNIQNENTQLDLNWSINRSIISITGKEFYFNTDAYSHRLVVGKMHYLHKKKIDFITNTYLVTDTIKILNSDLNIESVNSQITGDIINGNDLALNIMASNQDLNLIITYLPEKLHDICSPFLANGNISLSVSLDGIVNQNNNPHIDMEYSISEGNFILKKTSFKLQDIVLEGTVTNGKNNNFNTTRIKAKKFNSNTENGYLNGEFILTNLNNYFLTGQFNSYWHLSEINTYFDNSPFTTLKGEAHVITNYKGNISFNKKFIPQFLNSNHSSTLTLNNVHFNYKKFPLNFDLEFGDFALDNKKIKVKESSTKISGSDFNFTGEITDLLTYIFGARDRIHVIGNVNSNYINFTKLMTLSEISEVRKKTILPLWIRANLDLNINSLNYCNFNSSNLTGTINYIPKKLIGNNIEMQTLNGNVSGGVTLTEQRNNHLKLITSIKAKNINIRKSFDAFNNYGQDFIKKEELKGIAAADLNIEAHWSPKFILNKKKLKIKSKLIVEKGELIDFKPLENLSSYISLDALKHVTFSTLENTIDVVDEIITIPTMEIKSSALSVFLSGTHAFNQEINYDIKLLLSELLSSSFRKNNTNINEFGVEEQDGKIFNTIYLKMTGNTDNPKISLNKIRFMEDISKGLKKEKETINNIIKEDILQKEKKEEKEEGQDIDLEWNPEF